MITSARPNNSGERAHYYRPVTGEPVFSVPCKSRDGTRSVNIKDCRELKLVPSPTTVVKLLHRHILEAWKIEQAVIAAVTTPRIDGEGLDAFIERVIQKDEVQNEERNAAAERGKRVHAAIQEAIAFMVPPPPDIATAVIAAHNEVQNLGRVVATEKRIIGDGYVGTTDLILDNDHEVWVVDFKTCRKIPDKPYDEQKLQISAYAAGLGNTGNKRIRSAICYVNMDSGEIKVVETEWEHDYKRFRLLLGFWMMTAKII